jgi:hypothetical protein
VTPAALVGVYRWFYAPKDVTFLRFCFSCAVNSVEEGRKLDDGIVAARWLSFDELKERKNDHRSPLVQKCVDDFLAGRNFPLEVLSKDFA